MYADIRCMPVGHTLIFETVRWEKETLSLMAAQRTGNHCMSKV